MKIRFSSFSIIAIFTFLSIVGLFLIPFLNIQLIPTKKSSSLEVKFYWPDVSAKIIEQEVTSKLEGVFNSVKGVEGISSDSDVGRGLINIKFKKDIDMDAIRFEISSLIRQSYSKLPNGVSYPELSKSSVGESQSPILSYRINANESPYFIEKYANQYIIPKISQLNGVSRVSVYGIAPYEWLITYDADKIHQLQIDVEDISTAVNTFLNTYYVGKGELITSENDSKHELSVQIRYYNNNEIKWSEIPIKRIGDRAIYLRDIAEVRFKEGKKKAYYRINGLNTLNLVIYSENGVNNIQVTEDVKKVILELKKEISKDYKIQLNFDSVEHLVDELNKIKRITSFSLVALLILTLLIYRNTKYLIILFLSILVNLLVAVIFYYFFRIELQLYSFAGITISFGIIIDNSILMLDHLRTRGNKRVFLAILAATLTTIGAVLVIFLLEEEQKLNLIDFALIIAINIGTSLIISLCFIPALVDRLKLTKKMGVSSFKNSKKKIINFTLLYKKSLTVLNKRLIRRLLVVFLVFMFGIPLHLLPKKIETKSYLNDLYNRSLGNDWFNKELRPTLEIIIGGSFRLFTENIFEKSYYSKPERTKLTIHGSMPDGCTINQLNEAIGKMERYVASFDEIEVFETRINSYKNSNITIYFKEEFETGGFPYTLKNYLENKAISLGGLDWGITGIGLGFSNASMLTMKGNRVLLEGYNYDRLYAYAESLKNKLIKNANGRVSDVEIKSNEWFKDSQYEFRLGFNQEQLAFANKSRSDLYRTLKNKLHLEQLEPVINKNELQNVTLVSNKFQKINVWDIRNMPIEIDEDQYKLKKLASIEKLKIGNKIKKVNQQYRLLVAFDYIGSATAGRKYLEESIEQFQKSLPLGFKVLTKRNSGWNKDKKKQYYYLLIIVVIIFFICSIVLESLIQPLIIISMIPISFIGLFLTFYFFDFNFDQGGYAAFVLLCGISVNSALYIINEFNNLNRNVHKKNSFRIYFKAFNNKIIPVLITIISTIIGLLPFVWSGQNEPFWFSFAVGSIGGLLFSFIGVFVFLPLFMLWNKTG